VLLLRFGVVLFLILEGPPVRARFVFKLWWCGVSLCHANMVFFLAFLDGFTPGGFFIQARRPSAPKYLFRQEDDAEPDDALRGEQPLNS
jgi:hypothetical protein